MLISTSAMAFAGAAQAVETANGTLVVAHDTEPDDGKLFTYMVDGQSPGGAGLDDAPAAPGAYDNVINTKTFSVIPGDYSISQGDPGPGWALENVKCEGALAVHFERALRKVTLNVPAGTFITCKFSNRRIAPQVSRSITIRKQVNPDHPQDFKFTGVGPNGFNQNFTLDDDAAAGNSPTPDSRTFSNLPAGSYSFKELLGQTPGWALNGISCGITSPTSSWTPNPANGSVQITLGEPTQNVFCTFTNRRTAPPPPCTGYPYNASIALFTPAPTTVHICRGGTVTFSKTGPFSSAATVSPTSPAGSFAPVSLGAGNSSGTAGPFQNPGTFNYGGSSAAIKGTIIVHP
jgi:hypothetical protein